MSQGLITPQAIGLNNTTAPNKSIQLGGVDNSGNLQANCIKPLSTQVLGTDQGIVTHTVIHGLTTAGGGAYVDVKVNPSGTLAVAATINDGTDTALVTAAGELNVLATAQPGVDIGDVTINNAAGASAVNIQDGGNSITVDGTVGVSGTVTTKETRSATPSQTSVADNAASTTILASNANRLGATISNDSSAALYLLLGSSAASTTSYTVRITQYGYYEVPFGYTGQINGIWASDPNDGAARVTELTA